MVLFEITKYHLRMYTELTFTISCFLLFNYNFKCTSRYEMFFKINTKIDIFWNSTENTVGTKILKYFGYIDWQKLRQLRLKQYLRYTKVSTKFPWR